VVQEGNIVTIVLQSAIYSTIGCDKHKTYFVGYIDELKGKIYAFRCEGCNRPFYIRATKFWKGTP
jgi:hypothetical protein